MGDKSKLPEDQADALTETIVAYWRARGKTPYVVVVEDDSGFVVRSDMIDGLPSD